MYEDLCRGSETRRGKKVLIAKEMKSLSCVQFFVTPMGCSLPDYSVHGTLQARILEWVAILFSRGSSRPRDRNWLPHCRQTLYCQPPGKLIAKVIGKERGVGSDSLWGKETGVMHGSIED